MSELDQYDYELPTELIAQEPLVNRADARLLVVHRAENRISHSHIRNLPEILNPGDCVVYNNTRVVPARLIGYRDKTRGRWEGLFLSVDESGGWKLLCKTRGKPSPGEVITVVDRQIRDAASLRLIARLAGGVWLVRPEEPEEPLALLDRAGRVPLPQYIRGGEMTDADLTRYQTVFAEKPGAVAAPTAGLHFTQDLLRKLQQREVMSANVTLHVGIDTFRPITVASLAEHEMHSEWGAITADNVERIRACRAAGGRVVAIGTTSVRVLETAAAGGDLQPWEGQTRLFIRPPYEFKAVDALLTNFHLPRTTLLVMIRAFGGDALIRRAYDEAVREGYRFYSYGDAMLIL